MIEAPVANKDSRRLVAAMEHAFLEIYQWPMSSMMDLDEIQTK